MALTQQLARVAPHYLEQCRQAAAVSPDGDPHWDPPHGDTLDLDWAIWELLRFYRRMRPDEQHIRLLQRAIDGDPGSSISFLDHPEVHDGFDAPPALLAPEVVTEVADGLAVMDIGPLLADLPAYRAVGGFSAFTGDPRGYLVEHFTLLQNFYRSAGKRGMAVVTWVD
ncbi:DUF1877 domain-containing protein [Streptomyces sp. NPDC004111]|uniref:DUF1877 domain-containing protein n=1 Tax=Streptomyces sp. NPDC004111 TaxID=3364690 RepID=UPI0036BE6BA8